MYSSTIYRNAPITVQSGLISLRAQMRRFLREGRYFSSMVESAERSQWLSRTDLVAESNAMLHAILTHAVTHVPHYRDLGIASMTIERSPQEEIAAFPLLDKASVRAAGRSMITGNHSSFLFKGSTSGTTGSPLTLYQDLQAIIRENAFTWRQLTWAGYAAGARRAWLRGDLVVPAKKTAPPFWRCNRTENMLMFSSYHLSESNASIYLDALSRFDPVIIQAYPSSIGFLAAWLEAGNKTYTGASLKGIVTSSETLEETQRGMIERQFGCRVFDWYGQFERVAAIGTCEHGRYHLNSDYSYVEFLPANDGLHEVVGTGFNNLAMPLIRYQTGDFVELDNDRQCNCGRGFPLIKRIVGRRDDYINLPDGRQIGRLDHIFKKIGGVLEGQIVQDALDEIVLRIVTSEHYSDAVECQLIKNARERLGSQISIRIERVSHIERMPNGKLRAVVCNI